MMKISMIIFSFVLLFGCQKNDTNKTEIYNQKANELISEILQKNNCDCMLEIPKESLIEISKQENPNYDIRTDVKFQLDIKTDAKLDSLIEISKEFKLDSNFIKKRNIKVLTLKNILNIKNGKDESLKICKTGIICIQKPIFDENYKKAVFEYGYAFSCVRILPIQTYKLKKGKWFGN